jgi:hypothetical protein
MFSFFALAVTRSKGRLHVAAEELADHHAGLAGHGRVHRVQPQKAAVDPVVALAGTERMM